MNIFHKIALQGLKKNRTRTIVTIIGVVLSSLMITGVLTFAVSLLDYMADGARQKYGDWYAAFLDADQSFLQERMQDEEVSDTVSFQNIGCAELEDGKNPDKPYFFIAGYRQNTFDVLPTTLVSGRLPENDSEVLVSAKVMTDAGISYQPGDVITLSVGRRMKGDQELSQNVPYSPGEENITVQEEKTYTVVGTCRTPVFETEETPGYTLITRDDTMDDAKSLSLFVTLKNPRNVYSYMDKVQGDHACILNYDVLRIMGISNKPSDRLFMVFLYSFGGIVLSIIMTGSVFLIYNSFSISLSERIREIGVLASVGATARQLRNSVLFEGLCIGLIGIPIGVLMGLVSIGLVISAISKNFGEVLYSGVSLDVTISAPAIIMALAVSLITILISAWLPAKKAVKMPVMECIRQTNDIKVDAKAVKVSRWKRRIYGLEGTLALKNFKRNKKRYRSIVLSLILSIVLFVSTNALIKSMQQTADGFKIVSDFDIGFGVQDMEDDELLQLFDKMKNVEGVQEGSCRAALRYFCSVPSDALTDACKEVIGADSTEEVLDLAMDVHFFDDAFYQNLLQRLNLSPEEYTGQNGKLIAVAKINNDSDEVKGAQDLEDIFRSESVDFTLTPQINDGAKAEQGQNVSVTTVEFTPPDIPPVVSSEESETLPYTFQILAPWSVKENLAPSDLPIDVTIKGLCFDSEEPSQSVEEMRKIVQEEGITSSYILLNCAEAYEQYQNYIFIANVFAYIFIALISLIAIANVFNTISTNIKLRRRELAMLRSVGMSDKDFNKMMCFESAFYGVKALMIGIPLSLICSVLITEIMMTDETKFVLPWGSLGVSVLSVFFIIFVTMMYAVNKLKKENIIDALRDEMS